jgi:16S rRNA (guanine527-N7)-methyltransferase
MNPDTHSHAADTGDRLNALLAASGQPTLSPDLASRFGAYCELLLRWNARVNLTAIRNEDGILRRHFLESILCASAIPSGTLNLLDIGSGAGFPGIPIALCRPEIAVTLAESQGKKAAFLREALRVLDLRATVHAGRAEALTARFDAVTVRAVDRMESAVSAAIGLTKAGGVLLILTTESSVPALKASAGQAMEWQQTVPMPGSEARVLLVGTRMP